MGDTRIVYEQIMYKNENNFCRRWKYI